MTTTPDGVNPPSEAVDVRKRAEDKAASLARVGTSYTSEQINVIKSTVAVGASNEELALFLTVAQRSGLDPFTKQIHFVKRWDTKQQREVGAFQVGIDGFRVIAARSPRYQGRVGPWWCGKDGVWHELWTAEEPPFAAKVGVVVEGYREPVYATARWLAYRQTKKDGGLTRFWAEMGPEQLAKCAEALALRIAFPNDLSGLETDDEMAQADNHEPRIIVQRPAAAAIARDEKIKKEAAKSVAEVLGNELNEMAGRKTTAEWPGEHDDNGAGEATTDTEAAGMDDAPAMSAADRAEVLMQGTLDDLTVILTALRQATKGARKFYEMDGARVKVVDAGLLMGIGRVKNGGPVNTWLDQILKSATAHPLFCKAVLETADSLGVEVVR